MPDPRRSHDIPPAAQPGEIVAGKYRVDRVLGRGGMGVVVAATHLALDQRVALKFVHEGALGWERTPTGDVEERARSKKKSEEALERFLREARAAAKMKSEHVARVFDVDVLEGGEPYIVMELLEGQDLARLKTERGGKLTPEEAAEYVLQACEALVEAHALGVVHRDLKPQNLFLTRKVGGAPLVKVLDFGISKASGPAAFGELALTDTSTVLGSPLYMAPEQMRSAKLADARSDVWALGVVLYELCGGRVPFDAETVTELCLKVVQEPPEPLAALAPDVPEGLASAVMRCLEKDPEARFPNVAELAIALEPYATSTRAGTIRERPWRSFADTARSHGIDEPPPRASGPRAAGGATPAGRASAVSAPAGKDDKGSTGTTWGGGSTGAEQGATERRRGFAGGLLSGIGVCAIGFAAVFWVVTHRPEPGASSASASAASVTAEPPRVADPLPSARQAFDAASASASAAPAASASVASAASASITPGARGSASAREARVEAPRAGSPAPTTSAASSALKALGRGAAADPPTTAPPAAPRSTAEPLAPNGAPILH